MKRFIIISALLLAVATEALACGGWARPDYYVFSAYNRLELGYTFSSRLTQQWKAYAGPDADVEGLQYLDLKTFDKSDNTIVRKALDSGDKEMVDYLRLLAQYLEASAPLDDDAWSYPTKSQRVNRDNTLQMLHSRATSYTGKRLQPQYRLLAMRTLMAMGDTKGILTYWESTGKNTAPGVYTDMMRNIYAGALLRTGKVKEACDIYAEQGDMLSLKYVMRDGRSLRGIRSEYERDPNAPTLVYLVQDFVNNGSQTLRAQYEYDWDNPQYIAGSQREMREFISFAQKVVSQGESQCPALWQSAAGYLTCQLGDVETGLAMLGMAQKLAGTPRMKDNARLCRWVASMAKASPDESYQRYFVDELKWVQTVEKADIDHYNTLYGNKAGTWAANHYTEVLSNVFYDIMPDKAKAWGNTNLATAMMCWMYQHEMQQNENYGYSLNGDYYFAVDSLTALEMISYHDFVRGTQASGSMERYFKTAIPNNKSEEYFDDLIGTKFIREGNFTAAVPYLQRVSLGYLSKQATSYYMARRVLDIPRWEKRQVVCHDEDGFCEETPTAVKSNQKLDFCNQMLSLQKVVADPSQAGISAAEAKYMMAALLYQASYKGDCWYISRYSQSIGDDCCYKSEKDFVAWSAHLLDEARLEVKNDKALELEIAYARAFVPYGSRYITVTYDANYNSHESRDKNSREYTTMNDLATVYRSAGKNVPRYISRCDVLKQFNKGTFKGHWEWHWE